MVSNLSIIIVNYNSKKVLEECLQSIQKSDLKKICEIIIIDNASSQSIKDLANNYQDCKFIFNKKNIGFAGANNIGIKQAKSDFILLLNPDTIVNKKAILRMLDYLKENKKTGIVGCKIYNLAGDIEHSTHSFPSIIKEFFHANQWLKSFLGYDSFFVKIFKRNILAKDLASYWDHNELREVDHVTGACMMVKKEAIEKAGLLDEAFFLYNEEVEWSYRIKKAGYNSVFLPDVSIIHLFGYTTKQKVQKQIPNKLLLERYRGMFYYFQKHYGILKLFLLRIIVLEGFLTRLIAKSFALIWDTKRSWQDLKIFFKIIGLCFNNNFDWRKNENSFY